LLLVRRARAGLDAMRLLQGAARGALAGGGVGLVTLLAMKLSPAWPVAAALPWALLSAGALLGLLVAVTRPRIPLAAAALFLDRRLETHERFVTVVTRPAAGPFTDHVAAELEAWRRLPRLPFPREAALVPVALFLVFSAGLLPAAGAGAPGPVTAVIVPAGGAGGTEASAPPPEIDEATLRELEEGKLARTAALREMLERRLHRPEDRKAARDALDRALEGDRAAAKGVAETVRALRRARGGGVMRAAAYPEEEKFLKEYRRVRAEEGR
jgi:hypothetical protein